MAHMMKVPGKREIWVNTDVISWAVTASDRESVRECLRGGGDDPGNFSVEARNYLIQMLEESDEQT